MFIFNFFKNLLGLGFKLTQLWLGMSWGQGFKNSIYLCIWPDSITKIQTSINMLQVWSLTNT
jgi:hypothetical protein